MAEAKKTETKTTTKRATTKKAAEPKVEEPKAVEAKAEKVVDERDVKLAEQQAELDALKAQMQALLQAQMGVANTPKKPKKSISFVNLCSGGLTLVGNQVTRFDKQFDVRTLSAAEALAVITKMPNAARQGLFYIMDADFVEENDLTDVYESLLDDTALKNLLNMSADYVVEIYKNASQEQKHIIEDMITNRKMNSMPIDANIVVQIGAISGIDFGAVEDLGAEEQ